MQGFSTKQQSQQKNSCSQLKTYWGMEYGWAVYGKHSTGTSDRWLGKLTLSIAVLFLWWACCLNWDFWSECLLYYFLFFSLYWVIIGHYKFRVWYTLPLLQGVQSSIFALGQEVGLNVPRLNQVRSKMKWCNEISEMAPEMPNSIKTSPPFLFFFGRLHPIYSRWRWNSSPQPWAQPP